MTDDIVPFPGEPVSLTPVYRCTLCREDWPNYLALDHYMQGHQYTAPFVVIMVPLPPAETQEERSS